MQGFLHTFHLFNALLCENFICNTESVETLPFEPNFQIHLDSIPTLFYNVTGIFYYKRQGGKVMKKKFLATALSLTIALSMLAGCGSSEKDYENDIEVIEDIADIDFTSYEDADDAKDMKKAVKELKKEVKALDFSTEEGKAIQDVLLEFVSYTEDFVDECSKLDEDDTDDLEKMYELLEEYTDDIDDLEDDLVDALEDFIDAADDAGVDEDDLEDLDF